MVSASLRQAPALPQTDWERGLINQNFYFLNAGHNSALHHDPAEETGGAKSTCSSRQGPPSSRICAEHYRKSDSIPPVHINVGGRCRSRPFSVYTDSGVAALARLPSLWTPSRKKASLQLLYNRK